MNFQIQDRSVIVLAEAFNPSMFNQHWLISNDILTEEEELSAAISTPQVSNFKSNEFSLLVLPNQLQFGVNPELKDKLPYDKLVKVLSKIGYAPITAIGINFKWKQDTEGEAISKFTRTNYCSSSEGIFENFAEKDAKFGLYISKDFGESRLRLNILPVKDKNGEEYIQYSFNFHHDLNKETDFNRAIDLITKWKSYFKEANRIVDSFQ